MPLLYGANGLIGKTHAYDWRKNASLNRLEWWESICAVNLDNLGFLSNYT